MTTSHPQLLVTGAQLDVPAPSSDLDRLWQALACLHDHGIDITIEPVYTTPAEGHAHPDRDAIYCNFEGHFGVDGSLLHPVRLICQGDSVLSAAHAALARYGLHAAHSGRPQAAETSQ